MLLVDIRSAFLSYVNKIYVRTNGLPTLAARTLTEEEITRLRQVCDDNEISYGLFCGLIVKDVLNDNELTTKYLQMTKQFQSDRQPASIEELKKLRERVRQQEEELAALRAFKETALESVNGKSVTYSR